MGATEVQEEQIGSPLSRVLDQRCVEAFQDGWISLEGHDMELLEFPIGFLRLLVFQLLRDAVERPMQVCWRKMDATSVSVRFLGIESKCSRASMFLERILTVSETCRMQGRSVHEFVMDAVTVNFDDQKSPSLLPLSDELVVTSTAA